MEATMRCCLLDIPEDIIDFILELLLPQVEVAHRERISLPTPTDLSTLASVCTFLHRMALPWMWKRATIRTQSPVRFLKQWNYLRDHPQVAKHIRFLSVELGWSGSNTALMKEIREFARSMQNIQVLQFFTEYNYDLACEIYTELIRKPRLHTLIFEGSHIHDLNLGIPGIKRLRIARACGQNIPLHDTEIRLESLMLWGSHHRVSTIQIPWATLRHIVIEEAEDWPELLENFSLWRKQNPDASSPLTSIAIGDHLNDLFIIYPRELSQFITVFQEQTLTHLFLPPLKKINESMVSRIVNTFPQLETLVLLSRVGGTEFPSAKSLNDIAPHVNLQQLKSIYLGYSRPGPPGWQAIHERPHKEILPTVRLLANQCRKLELVHVNNCPKNSTAYFIERDHEGRFRDCKWKDGCDFCPSPKEWESVFEYTDYL